MRCEKCSRGLIRKHDGHCNESKCRFVYCIKCLKIIYDMYDSDD